MLANKILNEGDFTGVNQTNYKYLLAELALSLKNDFISSDKRFDNFLNYLKLITKTREDMNIVGACLMVLFKNENLFHYISCDPHYRKWSDEMNEMWYKTCDGVYFDEESYLENKLFFEIRLNRELVAV